MDPLPPLRSPRRKNSDDDDDQYQYQLSGDEDDDDDDDDDDGDGDEEVEDGGAPGMRRAVQSGKAEEIGYVVTGALERSEKPFKLWEPVYAVVQVILNKVLMLGSRTQTIIGRPILPDAAVHAVIEEHALDAKIMIFKKKRRKNYCRTRGHRQMPCMHHLGMETDNRTISRNSGSTFVCQNI